MSVVSKTTRLLLSSTTTAATRRSALLGSSSSMMATARTMSSSNAGGGAYEDAPGEGFTTTMLHHGHKLDTDNRARAVPIFQTTSFEFKSAHHGGQLFGLAELGPIYTRIMNPTNHVLEYKMAKLEGAPCPAHGDCDNAATLPSALALASGQSAQMHALFTLMESGDNFVTASELYGGTYTQFAYSFKQLGIESKFANVSDLNQIQNLIDDNTKCIYIETLANPSGTIPDFEAISKIAQEAQIPVVCDNTFGMGGYTCRPLKLGADVIVESATKWIGGHGTSIGGIIVDGSSFDWTVKKPDGSLKFPLLGGPQEAYHGANFAEHREYLIRDGAAECRGYRSFSASFIFVPHLFTIIFLSRSFSNNPL